MLILQEGNKTFGPACTVSLLTTRKQTMKSAIASHIEKVNGEDYVCQTKKNEQIFGAKFGPKIFNLKRHIASYLSDIFQAFVKEEQE